MSLADAFNAEAGRREPELPTARLNLGNDGGDFEGYTTTEPVTDFGPLFRLFNLDPDEWLVDDDTVRMSMWQQSRRTETGERDVVNLYSYRAKFRRRSQNALSQADVDALAARLWKPANATPRKRDTAPVAAVLNMADLQLHKGDPAATIDRIRNGVEKFKQYVTRHRAAGVNIDEIVLVNNGDPFEGIAGNYANQTNTIWHGGLRAQMNAVLDVWTYAAHETFPLAPKTQFVSVLCNHTQFGRQGGAKDAITGDSDNGSAFLAETMQRIIGDRYSTEWTIPHDEMNVYANIAGVDVGFNHGHKIPGSGAAAFEKWLGGQVRYDERAYRARVWVTAHKHHFASWDMGSAFVYQAPSCDDGSKWLTDTTGIHARSGMLAMLIGQHDPLGTSDASFL